MKSPQVVQRLRNCQRLCRQQFLLRCQAAKHTGRKSSTHAIRHHYCESAGQVSGQKLTETSASYPVTVSHDDTVTDTAQPSLNPSATAISVTDTCKSGTSGIWSKSDSAFLSFTSVSKQPCICNMHRISLLCILNSIYYRCHFLHELTSWPPS